MPYIIGTAGHIDHGKTSLVKCLTGQDTDRLKEEKERGISIDLGFAHFDLPDGRQAGVVDVPGHEKFIRNMLAGAHAIDLALITVAADDGVMPQTEEHFDILHLLGIQRAIFVITKSDIAPTRIQTVEEEIRILMAETSLESSPIVPVSALTGQGIDELRGLIVRELQLGDEQQRRGFFRLPVDRVFTLQGHGLIVTGTALGGEINVGEHVRRLPGDQMLRVRSLQVHNQSRNTAAGGQRVALNLSGGEEGSIERGHVICHEKIMLTSNRFDAILEARSTGSASIRNHQRVRIHIGTSERIGKVTLLGELETLGPKQSGYCQITIAEPVLALRGDRFIIRDETASRTLGGGTILHPWAKRRRRREPGLHDNLQTLHKGPPDVVVRLFIDQSDDFAVSVNLLCQFLNLRENELQDLMRHVTGVRLFTFDEDSLYTTETKWRVIHDEIIRGLQSFHADHPLWAGMDMEQLRTKMSYDIGPRIFRVVIEQMEKERAIVRDGKVLSLPDHKIRLRGDEHDLLEKIKAILSREPLLPPDLKELERQMGITRARLNEVLRVLERDRSVVRVSPDMYFLAESVERVKRTLCERFRDQEEITPANFRELFGTSRKYAIPLLEYLDRQMVTKRVGDVRRLKGGST